MCIAPQQLYDLFVIGGGINGAAVACDAAGRGLAVALVEERDFAEGTSSRSSKLIHGGLRYLETYDFRLVRGALREREILMAKAPHLVWPIRFVLPHVPGLRPRWMIRCILDRSEPMTGCLARLFHPFQRVGTQLSNLNPTLANVTSTGAVDPIRTSRRIDSLTGRQYNSQVRLL